MIGTLPAVSLAELNARAALLDRVDRKYVVPAQSLGDVLALLPARSAALEIGGRRSFGYCSEYYDTPDLLTYRMAAGSRRRRFKIRLRCYDDLSSWLEVKARAGRGRTQKHRLEAEQLDPGWIAETLRGEGEFLDPTALRLTLQVSFSRSTLLIPAGDGRFARLTFDTNLRWVIPGVSWGQADFTIIETKSPGRPTGFDKALWEHARRPERFSKYATGLAWLRPELPANKWHRGLLRYFGDGARSR